MRDKIVHLLNSLAFTKRYILALSLLAILSLLAFVNLTTLINSQKNDGIIINISGRQRMLTQQIALYTIQYRINDIKKSLKSMEEAHKKLLGYKMSDEIRDIYFKKPIMLDKRLREYFKQTHSFIKIKGGYGLTYILKHSKELVKYLDYITLVYQKDSEKKIKILQRRELYIFVLTLVLLLIEALFIFRPLDKAVTKKTFELKRQRDIADTIIEVNTNAIIAVDQTLKIIVFNAAAQRIFGYQRDEMIGVKLDKSSIIPAKYQKKFLEGIENFLKSGEIKHKGEVLEMEAQDKKGMLFPIKISIGVYVDNEKKMIVANIQNIQKEKEKDALLIHQSRLAAMGEMIGNIAHQWRQPLSLISTTATGIKIRHKNSLLSDEDLYKSMEKINEYTTYLSKTINDFRNFFQSDESEELAFDINEAIKSSISLVEASYKSHNIQIASNLSQEKLFIKGKESEFSQVIINILNNAKDVLKDKEMDDKVVYIKTYQATNKAYVQIQDSGGGIPEDIKYKIFEPYFTTKHKSEGTGIGLFMSQNIIKKHFKGSLKATNESFILNDKEHFGAKFSIEVKM